MPLSRLAVVDDVLFADHRDERAHPECPERLAAARGGLRSGLGDLEPLRIEARPADLAELTRVHRGRYVATLEQALRAPRGHLDPDTFFSQGSRQAAWCAAGSVIDLTCAIWAGRAQRGIALVRPPGHHAEADRAMGFCLLNNVAIAAAALLDRGAQRVAVVDWDVHHGNGTQHAFYSDPRVLFISLHQSPFYPGTGAAHEIGAGAGRGFTANVPLPAGSGPEAYAAAFRRVVLPMLKEFDPEMILVSAGFDAHADDPLASMRLDAQSYRAMASALITQAGHSCQGRIAWVLEGGYDLRALSDSVAAVTEAARGKMCDLPLEQASIEQVQAINAATHALRPHWPTLR
jgi:acetoin utilization deacetylase AcuC-like enzyme